MLLAGFAGMAGLAVGGADSFLLGATLVAFGLGWSWPGLLHHAALKAYPESPALATGYMQTGTFLGALVGPLTFGLVVEHASYRWAWSMAAAAVLLAAGLVLAVVGQLGRTLPTSRQRQTGDR
jgi:MFS family permease